MTVSVPRLNPATTVALAKLDPVQHRRHGLERQDPAGRVGRSRADAAGARDVDWRPSTARTTSSSARHWARLHEEDPSLVVVQNAQDP